MNNRSARSRENVARPRKDLLNDAHMKTDQVMITLALPFVHRATLSAHDYALDTSGASNMFISACNLIWLHSHTKAQKTNRK
jgi:hypothetical protein